MGTNSQLQGRSRGKLKIMVGWCTTEGNIGNYREPWEDPKNIERPIIDANTPLV